MTTTGEPPRAKFPLGTIRAAPGIVALCTAEPERMRLYLNALLARHSAGDWGVTFEEDREKHDRNLSDWQAKRPAFYAFDPAARVQLHVMSAYPIDPDKPCKGFGDNTIWIMTEEHSGEFYTTVFLPEEY